MKKINDILRQYVMNKLKPVSENKIKPQKNRLKPQRVFVNKRNGQITIVLPKKKMKFVPTEVQVTYW